MELIGERILIDRYNEQTKLIKEQIKTDKSFLTEESISLAKQIGYIPAYLPTRLHLWQWCQSHNLFEVNMDNIFIDDELNKILNKFISQNIYVK